MPTGWEIGVKKKMTPKEREDWIKETVVEGIKNANRKVKFLHRAVLAADPTLMREVIDYADLPDKTNVEVKFNWSHGHASPKLLLTHSNDTGNVMSGLWNPKPENFYIAWMVRNEDFFVLRWGSPDFVRDLVNRNNFDYVDGYYIGSEGYIPAKDYSHIDPHPHKTWKYAFEKQWLYYYLWGRLIYNPLETNESLAKEISKRYGKANGISFLKASTLSSQVPLDIATFYKGTWDFTLYCEGFLAPWQPDCEDGRSPFISLKELINHETLDASYLTIFNYCNKIHKGESIGINFTTPIQLSDNIAAYCDEAISLINKLGENNESPTMQSELDDLKTWCSLGYYFADKINAGVALQTYLLSGKMKEKKKALMYANKCLKHWKNVIILTENRYQLMPYVMMNHPENKWPNFKGFHWKDYLSEVEYDIEFIRSIE